MSFIQDNVNKIVKQKENQDLANRITSERMKNFESFLESQKNIAQSYTKEELEYINGIYYPEYLKCLKYLEVYADNLFVRMIQIYQFNKINFRNPFFYNITESINISGIGFPIPVKFQQQIKNTIENRLYQSLNIDDGEFVVNVIPNEYSITGVRNNIMKPIYSYTVNVEFKRKLVKRKQK